MTNNSYLVIMFVWTVENLFTFSIILRLNVIKLVLKAQAACKDFPETVTDPTDHNNVTDCVLFADRSHKPPINNTC